MQVLKVLEGHTSSVYSVAISTDGSKTVSGSGGNTERGHWPSVACGHSLAAAAVGA